MRYIFYCRNSTQETRSTFSRCTYYGYVGMETRHCTCYYFTGRSLKGSAKSSVRSAPLERLTLTKVPVRWSAVEKRSDSHQPEPASQPFTTTMRTAKKSLEAAAGCFWPSIQQATTFSRGFLAADDHDDDDGRRRRRNGQRVRFWFLACT